MKLSKFSGLRLLCACASARDYYGTAVERAIHKNEILFNVINMLGIILLD